MSGAVLDTDQAQSGINSDLALPVWQFSESCPLTSKSRYSPLWERFFKLSSYWNWNSKYPHSSTSLLLIHRNRSVPFSKTNNSGFTFNLYSRLPWIILSLKIPFSCHRQAYSPSLFFEKKKKEKKNFFLTVVLVEIYMPGTTPRNVKPFFGLIFTTKQLQKFLKCTHTNSISVLLTLPCTQNTLPTLNYLL